MTDTAPAPSTELAIPEPAHVAPAPVGGMSPRAVSAKVNFANSLAQADLLPASYQRKPGNVLLAVEYAEMLHMHPLTAIQQVHVIEGKLSMSSELMRSMVHRAGHKFRIIEHSSSRAVVEIVRGDDPDYPCRVEFNLDDARRAELSTVTWERWENEGGRNRKTTWQAPAGLPDEPNAKDLENAGAPQWVVKQGPSKGKRKDNWRKYPAAMLLARATSAAVRAVCPEVLMGISYTPDELGADIDEDGNVLDVDEASPEPPPARLEDLSTPVKPGWAKTQLLTAVDGDKARAGELWEAHFAAQVAAGETLTVGDVRALIANLPEDVEDATGDDIEIVGGTPADPPPSRMPNLGLLDDNGIDTDRPHPPAPPAPGGDDRPERTPNDASSSPSATTAPRARASHPVEDPAGRVAKRAAGAAKRAAGRAPASREHVDTLRATVASLDPDAERQVTEWLTVNSVVVEHGTLTADDYERAIAHIDKTVEG